MADNGAHPSDQDPDCSRSHAACLICACLHEQDQLIAAVEDAGFDARPLGTEGSSTLRMDVSGMTCSHCSDGIQAALRAHPGVSSADVSVLTHRAEVSSPSPASRRQFALLGACL